MARPLVAARPDRPAGTVGPPDNGSSRCNSGSCSDPPGRLRPTAPGDSGGTSAKSDDAIERTAEKGPVKLFVSVQPREPRLSDIVQMDVTVEAQPDVEIKPPAFGQAVGDFLIRD